MSNNTKQLTPAEAARLAADAVGLAGETPSAQSKVRGVPSLLTLHTTEAEASRKQTETEKLIADPDISDEDFEKLRNGGN